MYEQEEFKKRERSWTSYSGTKIIIAAFLNMVELILDDDNFYNF